MENSDFAKAIRGEPNLTDACKRPPVDGIRVLRLIRDECPNEWGAILRSPIGHEVLNLWDRLKGLQ